MKPEHFVQAMVALFGRAWVSPAADTFAIKHNKLQRMATGKERIYPDTAVRFVDALKTKTEEIANLLHLIQLDAQGAAYRAEAALIGHAIGCDCDDCIPF